MHLIEIDYGSKLYEAELDLRDEMLRKPLGLKVYAEASEAEVTYRHFALQTADAELVACLMCVPLGPGSVKIRQMAVRESLQGTGLGRQLMQEVETLLNHEGIGHFMLHARHTAVGFYEKLGYKAVGEPFEEVGIPHQRMEKSVPGP